MQQQSQQRRIHSFVRRQGRMSDNQVEALATLWGRYGIDYPCQPLQWNRVFANTNPVILEIGFGMGQSLLEMAIEMPDKNFLGIEVHKPGVARLLGNIEKHQLKNLRIICHDAVEILERVIGDESLSGVQIYFPDPWPKKRHHKRRLIQSAFISQLRPKMKPGAYLHCATDWQQYAEHMMEVLTAEQAMKNTAGHANYAPRPSWRPQTKFETRGQRLGHGVWDLMFIKV